MTTRLLKNWFIVDLYIEIPPPFSLPLKILHAFFDPFSTFNVRGQNVKKSLVS